MYGSLLNLLDVFEFLLMVREILFTILSNIAYILQSKSYTISDIYTVKLTFDTYHLNN